MKHCIDVLESGVTFLVHPVYVCRGE